MRVVSEDVDGARVIAVAGELDDATAPRLIAAIEDRDDPADEQRLVLDLTEMTFMDSSGLGAILYAWMYATRHAARFVLVCPMNAHVRRTLGTRGVSERIAVVETRTEALATP